MDVAIQHWPQITMAAIIAAGALGQVRNANKVSDLVASVIASGVIVTILYFGGFWA